MAAAPYESSLKDGTPLSEAASALQKAVRRGQEEVAWYWAKAIVEGGFHQYVFKRLAIMASEDVGNQDPMAAVLVSGLYQSWMQIVKQSGKGSVSSMWDILAQAVLYLCRAPKNREVDEMVCYLDELMQTGWKPKVPAYALDAHTDRGRQLLHQAGVRKSDPGYWDSWWHEGTRLADPAGGSRYHGRLRAYGGPDGGAPGRQSERGHEVAQHHCQLCGCLGDVSCAVCGEELCLGHVVACRKACGRSFCVGHEGVLTEGVCPDCSAGE